MKRFLFLWALCLFCCSAVLAAQTDTVVVENARVRLVFATKPVPFVLELVQKPSGMNLIAEPADPNLFALVISQPKGGNLTVKSGSAKQGFIKVVRVAKSQQIVVQFNGLGPVGDMQVKLDGVLDDAEPTVRWSIAVDNPNREKLVTVRFPYVTAVPAIGTPDDDFIIAPASPGAIIENPAKNWPDHYLVGWPFPGIQSAQFCSYQDRTTGVYVASMDAVGCNRALWVSKQKNGYQLYQDYQLPESSATRWKSPYDVVLGVTSGTWQQTADIYKRWAVHQRWCKKTLVHRADIPDYWKHGPCIHTVEMRTYDPKTRVCSGSYYPQLEEHLRLFREKIDGPVVPMLAGWENHRRWTAGDYFPIFDEEHAKGMLGQIRRDGFRPFVYLSGLFYTFQNEGRDGGDVSGWERYTDSMVIDAATGKPKTYVLNESAPGKENVWKRHSYQLCPAAPETRKFFRTVLDKTHALGIDIVQMDQAAFGYFSADACYSTSHGHQPGIGPYQSQSLRDVLDDMRKHGKSLSPEFLLTIEELHEEVIPNLDGFHTREYREHFWYHAAPGARSLPLFTYLYHEYAIAYGGEGPHLSQQKNNTTVRDMAVNLVTGKTPAASVWSSQSVMAETHADQIKMLRNHSHLLKTEAQRFLMLGRMLHPLDFDVPSVTFPMGVNRGEKWHTEPFVERAVLTSSWQSPEGNVGHCLVNITDAKQTLHLQLDTRNAPGWAKASVNLYRADKPDDCEHVLRSVALPHEYMLELAPWEAVFFVIRPAS